MVTQRLCLFLWTSALTLLQNKLLKHFCSVAEYFFNINDLKQFDSSKTYKNFLIKRHGNVKILIQRSALESLFYFNSGSLTSQIQSYKSIKIEYSQKCIETLTESFGYMSKRIKTITKTKTTSFFFEENVLYSLLFKSNFGD